MTKQLSRIELLRQKLKEEKERAQNGNNQQRGNTSNRNIYPFWQMKDGESVRFRIFLDANEENDKIFYKERLEHQLTINGKTKKVPCRKMYGEQCPICQLSQDFYAQGNEERGKEFYRKKINYIRIMVLDDPLPPEADGTTWLGKSCNTQINNDLLKIIKQEISDPELGLFDDPDEGTDFIINKTKDGKYSTYLVGTGFARRPSAIPQEYRENIELIDLQTLLPEDLGLETVTNLLQAHLTGSDYDESSESDDTVETKTKSSAPNSKTTVKESVEPDDVDDEEDEDVVEVPDLAKATQTVAVKETKKDSDDSKSHTDLLEELRRKREARAAARK